MILAKRLTLDEVKNLLNSVGLSYIDGIYLNHESKLDVKCKCGKVFKISLRVVKNHIRVSDTDCCCENCRIIKSREQFAYTLEEVKELLKTSGLTLLDNEYINANSKLNVIGRCGHKFETRLSVILNRGHKGYCKKCVNAKERAYNWHGGYDSENEHFRKTFEFKQFRIGVMKRDNYRCVCCNARKELNAHHLDGYNWCIEKRTDINNGVCLCKECHDLFHSIYGYGFNTRKQFYEFLMNYLK